MTALDLPHADRLCAALALTGPRPRRRWRAAWSLWGPVLPLALAAGLIAGAALALLTERFT